MGTPFDKSMIETNIDLLRQAAEQGDARAQYNLGVCYETIGKAVHMSKRTVMKYVSLLEKKHLIRAEHTEVIREDGMKYNGTLRYTIAPFREAEEYYQPKQLELLKLESEKRWVQKELAKFTPAGDTA